MIISFVITEVSVWLFEVKKVAWRQHTETPDSKVFIGTEKREKCAKS